MYNSLRGTVTFVGDSELYLENAGVEWALSVPASSLQALPGVGEQARVYVYLHHRDDQLALYGFAGTDERSVFLDLLKVGGIGPRQAVKILSGMTVQEFVECMDNEDVARLSRIPGLGKKTAQKILLTLRGKLSLRRQSQSGQYDDIVTALTDMGFDRNGAANAVETTAGALRNEGFEGNDLDQELLRRCIVLLSSGSSA